MASTAEDGDEMAKPLHIQRLENAMRLDTFLNQVEAVFSARLSDDGEEGHDTGIETGLIYENTSLKVVNGITATKQEFRADKSRLYNFGRVKRGRKWLKNLLLSDTSDDEEDDITEDDFKMMLKIHLMKRKHRTKFIADKELKQYQYYSVGLLSNHDRFPEHQKTIVGNNKKLKEKKLEKKIKAKLRRIKKKEKRILTDSNCMSLDSRGRNDDFSCLSLPSFGEDGELCVAETQLHQPSTSAKGSGKKKSAVMSEAALTNKRRRLWVAIAKKEIPRAQKHMIAVRKEGLTNCKKMAQACQKEIRKAAITFQKSLKETPGRARRLTREMLLYWKRYEKVEKEMRKKAEKEAQEQLKMDIELREAKRQQRKLNFLITQTELYAHFMSRKLSRGNHEVVQERILNQLVDEPLPHGLIDDYDGEEAKAQALRNARVAFETQQSKTKIFDSNFHLPSMKTNQKGFGDDFRLTDTSISTEQDRPQPSIFKGKLKVYQLKGMNWLANLYDQGINGILADEMGLGKTVQSIAFLAHIAESQDIWGPFLIIAPASTLHNWQQEFSRFLPKLKVLPYWGNTSDRKILRKFWNHKDLHTEGASFHVLITSYQLVVQDVKYFQRIKWQYMVLDEAQAIKSSTSVRWKILLGFNCRNRLLLTGTPIQNSMAELWALLHFIMPTLFDSHEEFNEWFSKEIENHAENKSFIDEKHLSRLHMILKPFMLRRIKKDVENELSDKIEILLYCHLTTRQKRLYGGLKQKISIEDLLHSASGTSSTSQAQSATSSLMNLVMQFRKVCNHPELFERREVRSPFIYTSDVFALPKLVYRDGILCHSLPSRQRLIGSLFNIYQPENVYDSIFGDDTNGSIKCFSFLRFVGLSPGELIGIILRGLIVRWLLCYRSRFESYKTYHRHIWPEGRSESKLLDHRSLLISELQPTSVSSIRSSSCLRDLVFVSNTSTVYTHIDVTIRSMAETVEHRKMRVQKLVRSTTQPVLKTPVISSIPTSSTSSVIPKSPTAFATKQNFLLKNSAHHVDDLVPEFCHVERPPLLLRCEPTEMPLFLSSGCPKVSVLLRDFHCSDRSAAFWRLRSLYGSDLDGIDVWKYGHPDLSEEYRTRKTLFRSPSFGGLTTTRPSHGWSNVVIPDKEALVTDSGKLFVLDGLLCQLKSQGHRVLIYSQMTRMIDILEEYMWHRKHTYMRLDGSSKISERRDMVADFQSRSDIFVFLLSTRAGGLGINLTAADTKKQNEEKLESVLETRKVVFYDSDWNPTVDQQAMDRAHRLGQTKQVTVYRLICKGTIEERILQRAREKSEIQRMVISGGHFKPDTLKPKEVVSLLLDDDELEQKFRQRQAEKKILEDQSKERGEMKRKRDKGSEKKNRGGKRPRVEENVTIPASHETESINSIDSISASLSPSESFSSAPIPQDETSNEGSLVVDDGCTSLQSITTTPSFFASVGTGIGTTTSSVTSKQQTTTTSSSSSTSPSSSSKKNSNRSGRNIGRSRGRPKGTLKRSVSARSRVATFAATEVAGVQVGAGAAAYAAAYTGLNAAGSRSIGPSSGPQISRGSVVIRGQGVRMRGPITQTPTHRFPNPKSSNPVVLPTQPSQTKGMGFYVQNNPSP